MLIEVFLACSVGFNAIPNCTVEVFAPYLSGQCEAYKARKESRPGQYLSCHKVTTRSHIPDAPKK